MIDAAEIDNLVRRAYPYVAMINVITKNALMMESPLATAWNGTYTADGLLDLRGSSWPLNRLIDF